jgi:hypothetical protein
MYYGPLPAPYFRLNFTGGYTSGISQGSVVFSTLPTPPETVIVRNDGTSTGVIVQSNKNPNNANAVSATAGTQGTVPSGTNLGVLPAVANAVAPGYGETFGSLTSVDLLGQTRIKSDLPLQINNQQINGIDVATTNDGVQLVSLAGELGDPLSTTGTALNVNVVNTTPPAVVNSPLVGQVKIASTGTAINLPNQDLVNGIIISAPSGNAAPIAIGNKTVTNTANGTGNGYLLAAGASISFAVNNVNNIWINGTSGDYISWAGS